MYKQFKSGWEGIRRFVSIYDLPSKTTFRHGVNVGWIFTTVFIVILEVEGYVMGINLNNTPKSLLTAKYVNTIPCKNRWVNSVIDCNNKRGIPGPYRSDSVVENIQIMTPNLRNLLKQLRVPILGNLFYDMFLYCFHISMNRTRIPKAHSEHMFVY